MKKEYKINFIKSVYFQIMVVMVIGNAYLLFITIKEHLHPAAFLILFIMSSILGIFSYFYSCRLKVFIDDEALTVELPDRRTKAFFKNIYKIEKILGWGSFGYYIFYKDERGKKRTTGFPEALENYREVIDYISKKSDIQVKMGL